MENVTWVKHCNPLYDGSILAIGYDSKNCYADYYTSGIRAITNRLYNEIMEKSISNPITEHDNNIRHGFNTKFNFPYHDYYEHKVFMEKYNIIELHRNDYINDRCIGSEMFYFYDNEHFQGYVTIEDNSKYRQIRHDRFNAMQSDMFNVLMVDKTDLLYYPIGVKVFTLQDLDMKIKQVAGGLYDL